MDGEAADLNDWELLLASPTAADEAAAAETRDGGGDDEAGAIKYDYFELGSDVKYPERVSFSKELEEEGEGEEEEGVASGNASWVEPDPDDLVFPGPDRAALWSDSSDDGERREEAEATEPLPVEAAAAEVEAGEGAVTKGGGAGAGWCGGGTCRWACSGRGRCGRRGACGRCPSPSRCSASPCWGGACTACGGRARPWRASASSSTKR